MQVVAGSARRIQLKTLPGDRTRPTSNRIKETLFNILQPLVQGTRFLDLFAGSGAIGIEALSRGARKAVFVENSREACAVIKENLAKTRLGEAAEVMLSDASAALRRLSAKGEPFDIVFMDPPYDGGFERPILAQLASSPIVTQETLIIVEARARTQVEDLDGMGLELVREKIYKNNKHLFIKRKEQS